jgi:hypothetical protein
MTRTRLSSLAILTFATCITGAAPGARAADKPVLHLTAFAVDLGGPTTRARSGTLDIVINRWSTPQEISNLKAILTEKGADGLLDAFQKMKEVGHIRTPTSVGWPIHFAQQVTGSAGRRIIVATDRPMSFWELMNRPRSADYEFLLAEIRIGADGKGQGTLVPAGRIDYDNESNTLEVENYSTEPTRLTEVRVLK